VTEKLKTKLADLPKTPGVYFHKDATGEIIYIGKAANLRNRVRQYFQKSRMRDAKTDLLVAEIADTDWTELETEADALFLEAELVRRYLPRYNILLRDDKSQIYVRINYKSDYPTVTITRRPLDDGAEYFGPYSNPLAIKKALRYLRKAFPFALSKPTNQKRANLYYHLGLDPGLEEGRTNLVDYRANLRKLMQYLKGERVQLVREIEREMKKAAKAKDFETAAKLRNRLFTLQALSRQTLFGDREVQDASRDQALVDLATLLGLKKPPRRMECFDISHMQGTDTVASMVVFINGLPDKASYRKFKMRLPGNDDFAHMHEALTRRLRHVRDTNADALQGADEQRTEPYLNTVKRVAQPATLQSAASNSRAVGSARSQAGAVRGAWGLPDLIVIDGGKGQLSSALKARDEAGLSLIPMIGLAKREEEIIIHKVLSVAGEDADKVAEIAAKKGAYIADSADFLSIDLPAQSHTIKLLQRIRDESHRFAVSYHSTLKRKRQTASVLDEIPGIGPTTRKKLIRKFGSARGVMGADTAELQEVLGTKKGATISKYLAAYK
jgi:excinuclease ABC subunit C